MGKVVVHEPVCFSESFSTDLASQRVFRFSRSRGPTGLVTGLAATGHRVTTRARPDQMSHLFMDEKVVLAVESCIAVAKFIDYFGVKLPISAQNCLFDTKLTIRD